MKLCENHTGENKRDRGQLGREEKKEGEGKGLEGAMGWGVKVHLVGVLLEGPGSVS